MNPFSNITDSLSMCFHTLVTASPTVTACPTVTASPTEMNMNMSNGSGYAYMNMILM